MQATIRLYWFGFAAALACAACGSTESGTGSGASSSSSGAGGAASGASSSSSSSSGAGGAGQGGGSPADARAIRFTNQCAYPVWVGALNGGPYELPEKGGFRLDPGMAYTTLLPFEWGGRFWGRTGCAFDASGMGSCETADCGGKEQCNGAGGKPPATLAEFLFAGFGGKDFYDVSLVDGYNLPVRVAPTPGTFMKSDPNDPYDCGAPGCADDLNKTCPVELQQKNAKGVVVACLSACEKFGTDEYCCKGANNTPQTCPPTSYSQIFKAACPTAYSYAYDDPTSTFTCVGKDYDITFCP